MTPAQIDELRTCLHHPASLVTGPNLPEKYNHDATTYASIPEALLLAESIDDIRTAVGYCAEYQLAITARGAGTGLSGGAVVSPGGLLLSTERLRNLEIYPDKKMAVCGPGLITKELVDAANQHGLTYPPDPASYEESTLGGNVAENAGGLRCKRFGVTKDYLLGAETVLADGSLWHTGWFSDHRGLSLGDLLLGSEGTLGIIVNLAFRLIDTPARGLTMLVAFDDSVDAARTVTAINRAGLIPTVMEFIDGDAAACSYDYEQVSGLEGAAAILLLETSDTHRSGQAARLEDLCRSNKCSFLRLETSPESAEQLWRVRRNLSNATKEIAAVRVSEDVAVPNERFPDLVAFVAQLNRDSYLRINSFGHAGDGNLHVNFLAEADTKQNWAEIDHRVGTLMRRTIELGGTLTGEHGIGLAKQQYLSLEFDRPTLRLMNTIKEVFDSQKMFNPDKLFPVS